MKTFFRGAKRRLRIHPLFLLAGALSACVGGLFSFIAATLAAIEHECAHALVARRMGYRLNQIVLMPYGAVIKGDLKGISPKQEIAVCVAGPLVNAVTALFFVALWWLYPECYPYTEEAANISLSLFLVNLLPAYPLDGGRILRLALRPLGEGKARRICTAVTLVAAGVLLGGFGYSCARAPNFSLLMFPLFLVAGCFGKEEYSRITFSREKSFSRGVEERRVALSAQKSVGYALRFLREDKYTTFLLFQGEEFCGELSEEEFLRAVDGGDWAQPIGNFLDKI